jgi:hypothetical protein
MKVIVPPLEVQDRFERIAFRLKSVQQQQEEHRTELDYLCESLVQRAFLGGL